MSSDKDAGGDCPPDDLQRVRQLIQSTQHFELQSALLLEQIERNKELVRRLLEDVFAELGNTEASRLAAELYWESEPLAGAVTKSYIAIKKGYFPWESRNFQRRCEICNNLFEAGFTSWSQAADAKPLKSNALKARRHISKKYRCLCQECQEIVGKQIEEDTRRYIEKFSRKEERVEKLRTMPYKKYLQTDHWKETRKGAMWRARYRCQLCNAKGELHTHHRTYERRGCEEPEDLIVLCRACHEKHHDIIPTADGGDE